MGMSPGNLDLSFGGSQFPRALEVRQKLYAGGSRGVSTRYRRLDRLDAFYKCLEYEHHKTGWDGNPADQFEAISPQAVVPFGFQQGDTSQSVKAKRPTAPMRLTPLVVDRFTGLLFSKDRTPKVEVEGDADADDFLKAVWKKARFWATCHQARTFGGSMGGVLLTVQLREGRFSYTAHSPKFVHDVVWADPDLKIPAGVLIQYLFVKEVEILDEKTGMPSGRMKPVPWLYRRIIDEEWDIIFKSQEVSGNELPLLEPDMALSYEHKLGRFPGAWVQNLPSDEELDGVPDCDGAYQLFETIDRQVAQSNKGLLQNQDPTLVISRDKRLVQMGAPLKKGSENAIDVGQGGSAQYLEIGAAGINAAREFVKDLRQAAMDKVQAVLVDPTQISGAAQSAKAIEYIYGPMLEKAGRLRDQYGPAIEAVAEVTLELARVWADPLQYTGNVRRAKFDVPPKVVEVDLDPENPDPEQGQIKQLVPRQPGSGGIVTLTWGPYFAETPQDIQTLVTIITSAYGGGLIDLETAVRKVAALLKVEDVDGLLRRVREEGEAKEKQRQDQMGAMWPEQEYEEEPPDEAGAPPVAPPGPPA
jgi:hypothetical protein